MTKPLALGRRLDGLRRQNELRVGAPGGPGSERILQCKLYLARRSCALHLAEIRTVGDIAVGIQELRGVEDVEELGAELDGLALLDLCDLLDREIEVLDPRSAADGAFRGTERSKSCAGKAIRIER